MYPTIHEFSGQALWVAALLAALTGCADSPTSDDSLLLRYDGGPISDSIQTQRSVRVAVTNGAGVPRPNVEVLFELVEPTSTPCPPTLIGPSAVSTDAGGFASAVLRLGCRAGTETLLASVRGAGSLNIPVEQRSGAAIRVGFSESAIEIGTTRRIIGALDRHGNLTDDPVNIIGGGRAAMLLTQGTVFGQAYGMESFEVSAPGLGVAHRPIAVVPKATIAWSNPEFSKGVLIGDLTGRTSRSLLPDVPVAAPFWSPDGSALAFNWWERAQLWIASTADDTRRQLVPDLIGATWPHFSGDGTWLYFQGQPSAGADYVYRVHPDGSDRQLLIDVDQSFMPAPSPDGTRLAYVRAPGVDGDELYVRTLATGEEALVGRLPMGPPRWSPDGRWIAYMTIDGSLIVVRPDGSEPQTLGPAGPSISWSSDSRWIVTIPIQDDILLYDVQGGSRLVIPRYEGPGYGVAYAVWKP